MRYDESKRQSIQKKKHNQQLQQQQQSSSYHRHHHSVTTIILIDPASSTQHEMEKQFRFLFDECSSLFLTRLKSFPIIVVVDDVELP